MNSVLQTAFTAPNQVTWSLLRASEDASKVVPLARNAHTAVSNGNSIFIFGGQDDENNKLGDLWEFNVTTKQWA